ncbi:MAG: hypothetical protein MHPSP_000894 [Paramarteilia canceri]
MAPQADSVPRNTLYISNLDTKIKKNEMKSLLYGFFSPFGLIADIYFSRKPQMRGQAFIIFCDIVEASKAKRAMNGMSMLGRTLKIDFTTNESKIVSKTKMKVDNNSSQSVQKPVNISQQYSIDKTSCTLFVTNIPEDTLEEKLHEIFSV